MGSSCKYVRPVAGIYFRFFNCKNCNVGTTAAGIPVVAILIFAFPLVQIVMRGQQLQMCQANCKYQFSLFRLQKS